jgi:hypothetical protein
MARKKAKLTLEQQAKIWLDDNFDPEASMTVDAQNYVAEAIVYADEFEEGTSERRAADRYAAAVEREEQWNAWLEDAFDLDKPLTDDNRHLFEAALNEYTRRCQRTLAALDSLENLLRHTITVPKDEIVQIMIDSMSVTADAIPKVEHVQGLDRYRVIKETAADILAVMQEHRVKVREDDTIGSPPLCEDCAA